MNFFVETVRDSTVVLFHNLSCLMRFGSECEHQLSGTEEDSTGSATEVFEGTGFDQERKGRERWCRQ